MLDLIPVFFNFAVVLFIIWHYGKKPFADYLVERSLSISTAIDEAKKAEREAKAQLDLWDGKWHGSHDEAKKLMADTKAQIESLREKTISDAHRSVERIEKEARMLSEGEALRAKATLQKSLVSKSIELARRYVASEITEADQKHLVSDYVEKLNHGTA